MGFGASLAFIAVGAVLAFAVTWDVPGIDLHVIGWILIAVGAVGALLTGLYTRRPRSEEVVEVVEPDTVYTAEPTVVEPHVHVREEDPRVHLREEDPHLRRGNG